MAAAATGVSMAADIAVLERSTDLDWTVVLYVEWSGRSDTAGCTGVGEV